MLNSKLLLDYAHGFFGYGDLSAPIWFIGMEEGGGDKDSVQRRLQAWDQRGRRQVEDLASYHEQMGVNNLTTGKSVKIQSTWAKLIRFQIAAEGGLPETSTVRSFQASLWGREDSRTCLLELMPLPKKSAASWEYNQWTNIPELWSRSLYFAHFAAKRAATLRDFIKQNEPKVVVFYGKSPEFSCHWPWIAKVHPGKNGIWHDIGTWRETVSNHTRFLIAPHPVSHGSKNNDWQEMGGRVADSITVERPDHFHRDHKARLG